MILDQHTLNRTARGLRQQAHDASARAAATINDDTGKRDWLVLASACFGVAKTLEDIADLMQRLQLTELSNAA